MKERGTSRFFVYCKIEPAEGAISIGGRKGCVAGGGSALDI